MHIQTGRIRTGSLIPLAALCLIGLLSFVALALDLGLLMIARNQCQNAADAAALAGARTLTGDTSTNNNYSNAGPNATAAASANSILNQPVNPGTQLTVTIGDYYYNPSTASFQISPNALGQPGDNWNLVQATVKAQQIPFFGKVIGMSAQGVTATATATHRPRDTVIVVDFSGSMRFESLLGAPYSGSRTLSMNPDTVYPQFGHYASNSSQLTYSTDQQAASGEMIGAANTEVPTSNATTAVISGFYADATPFGTGTPAFTAASSGYATTPGGDAPPMINKNGGSSSAHTISEFLNGSTGQTTRDWRIELDGYSAYSAGAVNTNTSTATDYTNAPFNGYTQGPGYWGKTFFLWPPDPRVPLTTTHYTGTQIQNIVQQFLTDFSYTTADFANTSVTTLTAIITSSDPATITVPASTAANYSTANLPYKVMIGTTSSGSFTGTPEVLSVTAVSGTTTNGTTRWTVSRAQDGTAKLAAVTATPAASFSTSATSFTVNAITGFPTASLPFKIMVGSVTSGVFTTPESMSVTAVSGSGSKTWTVTRGQDGTTAVAGTTLMTVGLVSTIGLLTGPPLYGIYTGASTTVSATVGKTPASSSVWSSWADASTLGTYLTSNVYKPSSSSKLATSDAIYQQSLRLFNRNGGPGMPTSGSGTAMPCDWRARFFTTSSGLPLLDNSKLWSNGSLRTPSSSTYLINYNAILDWLKNCGPNPFPNQLRAGGIVYYTAIPAVIDTLHFPPTDPTQRFWKEYIDEVLGVMQTGGSGSSPTYTNTSSYAGYGADISWGTVQTSGTPTGWPTTTFISYTDNPQRPLLRCWFGPLTLIDFLGNYNASDPSNNNSPRLWWPGTVTEAPTYQTKLAIQAALKDCLQNHPNDNVSLIFFSSPRSSASSTGYYNYARVPLGRNERLMINSLWFSPKIITNNAEISIYNSLGQNPGDIYDVPRANGGTCYAMPLMLAYNQFSSNPALVNYTANASAGTAGGLGRNGASRLLIFETDGMVNTGASANLVSSSTGQGNYSVRIADSNNLSASGTEFPSNVTGVTFSTGASQSQTIAQQICSNLSTGGYSTTRKPVLIHSIAFGSLFESGNNSSYKTNALANLAALEVIGNVQSSGATTLASNKIIVGDFNTRIANLQSAFQSIMQDGIQVTLISSGSGLP